MINALLTIDDVPENNTIEILDYLYKRHIPAILFTIGKKASIHPEILIYAINHGFIIGNHSYTHPHFSDLTLDEATRYFNKTRVDGLHDQVDIFREYSEDYSEKIALKCKDYETWDRNEL